jgi:hypothetical protein
MRKLLLLFTLTGFTATVISQNIENADDKWFVWHPDNSTESGIIGMDHWLDAPAGKHGWLNISGSGFEFKDGTPIRFWGVNHVGTGCGPEKEEADRRVAWYAKMGVNAIRMIAFSRRGFINPQNSTELTPEGWKRLDYYWSKLKEKGIYFGWSPIDQDLVDNDSNRVIAYEELKKNRQGRTKYLVNFAPDLQRIKFDLATYLLNHKNPHTGLRYADDPTLIYYDMHNEDNIFWLKPDTLESVPTYKKMFCQQYSRWLKDKYGTQENLEKAWGTNGMDMFPQYMTGENLYEENIYPISWFPYFSPESINNSSSPRRMLDNAAFLYETQREYQLRFAQIIRSTGYKGPLVGSCWQAGQGVIHYYNLHTDYLTGIIDRHNYFAARPHRIEPGPFPDKTMLAWPGSGLFSSGLHAVKGRPFVLSEWISKMPNEWIAEGPAIIGVYGMGFQGWDASYHFNAGNAGFTNTMGTPVNVYNTNNITQIGQFPALARMIYRNDVQEGQLLPNRNVHIPSLKEGKIGFVESLRQQGDIKQLGGDVPIEALALGRLELEFTDEYLPTVLPDWSQWTANRVVKSNTGQLEWDYSQNDRGFFTVNTDGTRAVVGFTGGKEFKLGDISIQTDNPFAIIYITSLEKNRTIAGSDSLLVTTIARARNTGMRYKYTEDETILESVGDAPLLVEPVHAEITFRNSKFSKATALDHDGRMTEKTIPVRKGRLVLEGSKNKTVWYLVQKND